MGWEIEQGGIRLLDDQCNGERAFWDDACISSVNYL